MKILHRQTLYILLAALIPLFIIITVIFLVNQAQTQKYIGKQMSAYIQDFKTTLDTDLSKYRDYAYFIGKESDEFIVGEKWTTSNFPVNIESFDMRMYEVFYKYKTLYQDTYSWEDSIYFAPPTSVSNIWHEMKSQNHSIFYKMSFPEVLSNTLVIRNTAILTKTSFDRIGFVSVIAPLDTAYLSRIPFVNNDIILFIRTASNITFSNPDLNKPEVLKTILKMPMGVSRGKNLIYFRNLGKYYLSQESLYSQRIKVENRFQQVFIADVGIIFRQQAANRDFLMYQRVILIILLLSLIAFPVIAYFSAKSISHPILYLKEQVDKFKQNYTKVPEPPQIRDEISMLQHSFSEMSQTVIHKSDELTEALTELALANEKLGELTVTDGLTGINNRRYFNQKIESEIRRASRLNETLSLLMVDIDFFKKINDHYGHEAGDYCLKQLAGILKKHAVRSGDSVNRFGGEEFSLILPNTDVKGAKIIAERIRKEVEQTSMVFHDLVIQMTVSIGVAGFKASHDKEYLDSILSYADKALYQAKESGRNKVMVYKKERNK